MGVSLWEALVFLVGELRLDLLAATGRKLARLPPGLTGELLSLLLRLLRGPASVLEPPGRAF